ncbi:MAG: carboxylating nicotinate-nucleotide diphosphorylase [Thermodesulfovibrionia bacterium]|nr:carboxylating nicotinate-nucleotide diphosphorylase [Thermodesulfovibrionia bacterium]
MTILSKTDTILTQALLEDIGEGDVTTCAVIPENHRSKAVLIAKEDFVLAGLPFAERIFQLLNSELKFKAHKKDGDIVKKGAVIATINGNTRSLLMAERTALNLLQRLSGIATLTRRFVEKVKGLTVKIVDTRKTTPGLRTFEKYAVRAGGGKNHRFGLFDGILIKDNHINAAGSIEKAVKMAKLKAQHMLKIEVEAKNIREVRSALSAGAEIIMLDNMSIEGIKKSVRMIRSQNPQIIIEASGNINLENIRKVAEICVDLISIGALTHSARAVDISMDVVSLR